MKFINWILLLIVIISPLCSFSQGDKLEYGFPTTGQHDTIRVATIVIDGEVMPWLGIQQVDIWAKRIWKSEADRQAYLRLRYNVLKVIPYAIYAKQRYAQLERDLAAESNKKVQRLLVRQCDQEIKDLFNKEIKDLTITQGKILTKLVDRELGKSTFDLVKETRGGVRAFLYQSIARVVGHNLKTTYNAQEERDIESIIINSPYYSAVKAN